MLQLSFKKKKIVLVILVALAFHIDFPYNLVYVYRNLAEIFIGISLNLYISLVELCLYYFEFFNPWTQHVFVCLFFEFFHQCLVVFSVQVCLCLVRVTPTLLLLLLFLVIVNCIFFFLGMHLWHMEVLRLGVELELLMLAIATATATPDLSCICNLHYSSWQCWILNPQRGQRLNPHPHGY